MPVGNSRACEESLANSTPIENLQDKPSRRGVHRQRLHVPTLCRDTPDTEHHHLATSNEVFLLTSDVTIHLTKSCRLLREVM